MSTSFISIDGKSIKKSNIGHTTDIISVKNGKFAEFAQVYSSFHTLTDLHIADTKYKNTPMTDIATLPQSITELSISCKGFEGMDLFYDRLNNLESIHTCGVTNPVIESISKLQRLRSIEITNTKIPILPQYLTLCANLETLILKVDKGIDLSHVLNYIPGLRVLDVSLVTHNKNSSIILPNSTHGLHNLQELAIHHCIIVNPFILNHIEDIPNLTRLILSNTYSLTPIHLNTDALHQLREFRINIHECAINRLKGIEIKNSVLLRANTNFANNPYLGCIELIGDYAESLTSIPESLGECKKLNEIKIINKGYMIIPDVIAYLPNLSVIELYSPYMIKYMPYPSMWVSTIASIIETYYYIDINIKKAYYTYMSPDCICRNPYLYLNYFECITSSMITDKIDELTNSCNCQSPGLIDRETGKCIMNPTILNQHKHAYNKFTAQMCTPLIMDYIQRHRFTYPDPHPLLPQHARSNPEAANATTANP